MLIIYIRAILDGNEEPLTFFLDLVELAATNAEEIYWALMENLRSCSKIMFCFASNCASVVLGSESGVAAEIVQLFPNVLIWHCMNHCLELSVGDAVEEVAGLNQFQSFFDKVSLYHASAKNHHELTSCCQELAYSVWIQKGFLALDGELLEASKLYGNSIQHFTNTFQMPRLIQNKTLLRGVCWFSKSSQ